MRLALAVVLMLLAAEAGGAAEAAWYQDGQAATPWALTINDSKQVFGQWCSFAADACYWSLGLDQTCSKGARYPVLINATSGSLATEVLCDERAETGKQRLYFTNFDDIDRLVRASTLMGVAFPLQSGEFVVVRFSLNGAGPALDAMRQATIKRRGAKPVGTKDQRL
jgi:hypothetical protein